MKALELNQMEILHGGEEEGSNSACGFAIAIGAIVFVAGAFTGGWGWVIGGAGAAADIAIGCS